MAPTKAASKSAGTPGVKLFITAASVAATLGGWALLCSAEKSQPAAQATMVPLTPVPQAGTQTLSIQLAPLPTLVPLATRPELVTVNNAAPRGAVQAAPAAPAPSSQLTLRVVSAPPPQHSGGGGTAAGSTSTSAPAPVTNTRSSK